MFPHPVVQTHTYSTYIIIYVVMYDVVRSYASYQLYNILKVPQTATRTRTISYCT